MLSYRSETFRTDRRLEAILTKKKKRKKKKQLAVVEEEETAAAAKRWLISHSLPCLFLPLADSAFLSSFRGQGRIDKDTSAEAASARRGPPTPAR